MNHTKNKQNFAKVLGRKEVLALAFGAMIGWGWIVLTGEWILSAGSMGAILAMLIGSIIIIFIGLSYAELASAMPQEGGAQVFTYRALGHSASFICAWSLILGYVSVVAFEAVALPTVLTNLTPGYQHMLLWNIAGWDVYLSWALVGMVGTVMVVIINYFGVQNAGFFQTMITALIVVVGALFVIAALTSGHVDNLVPYFSGAPTSDSPFSSMIAGMLPVLMMVPFMFVGFDVIPQTAAEIDLPAKSIGTLLVISVFAAMFFYCAIIFGVSLALNQHQIDERVLTTPQAMQAVFGNSPWAAKIMVIAGLAGIITSWNAFFIGGSRAIYALAHAKMLPAFLGRLHPKYKTPDNAVLLIGAITLFVPLLGRPALLWFVNAGSLAIVIAYFLVCLSFLVLRRREPNMPRPFHVKNGTLIGVLASLGSMALIYMYMPFSPSALRNEEWIIFGVWMAAGAVMYYMARRKFGVAESQRIMSADWHTDTQRIIAEMKQNKQ